MKSFERYRKQIETIDRELLSLLARRFAIVKKIGAQKKFSGIAIQNTTREQELEKTLTVHAKKKKLKIEFILSVWKLIFRESKRIQRLKS